MGRIRPGFHPQRAEDPEAQENFLAAEARISTHYLGGAEMSGECGIIAAAN
jgi:hypothetical protein